MAYQKPSQPVDVAYWEADAEFNPYPVGARDKSLLISPSKSDQRFIKDRHRYLYKHSSHRYPEQYWVEIFSYRFGGLLGIDVPPSFAAYDSDNGTCGALIKWFVKDTETDFSGTSIKSMLKHEFKRYPFVWALYYIWKIYTNVFKRKSSYVERYTPGGDFLQRLIAGYDRKTGAQHNFEIVSKLCEVLSQGMALQDDWKKYWATVFVFDALIGNTDRHQDNWGIIWKIKGAERMSTRLTPVFDNGTSMGHEIMSSNFYKFKDDEYLERYISRGDHHMKFRAKDSSRMPHIGSIGILIETFPETFEIARNLLSFTDKDIENILSNLCKFDVPVPLTEERAYFMYKLICKRKLLLHSAMLEHV